MNQWRHRGQDGSSTVGRFQQAWVQGAAAPRQGPWRHGQVVNQPSKCVWRGFLAAVLCPHLLEWMRDCVSSASVTIIDRMAECDLELGLVWLTRRCDACWVFVTVHFIAWVRIEIIIENIARHYDAIISVDHIDLRPSLVVVNCFWAMIPSLCKLKVNPPHALFFNSLQGS